VPFGRCQLSPVQTASNEIAAVIPYDAQIGFVGIDDSAVFSPGKDPDDVGINEPPDLAFQHIGSFTQCCFSPFSRGDFQLKLLDGLHGSIRR
jgi:hypothetical protein